MTEPMTTEDIAKALKVSTRHAREKVVTRADFPRPAVALSRKMRRWDSADVQRWMESQRKRAAR